MTMQENQAIELARGGGFALPAAAVVTTQTAQIKAFQNICHQQMVQGHDYGVIPGTQKATLLKPGAEKIVRLLGLSDEYEILERSEDWEKGFFRYIIRCKLVHLNTGVLVSSGLGECNSMEARYRWRWMWERELPENFNKQGAVFRSTRNGGKQYRVENDDIHSQVNTILKMSKKRALVDAALSAGSLSDIFTQDLEDMADNRAAATPADEPPAAASPPRQQAAPPPRTAQRQAPPSNADKLAAFEAMKDAREALGWSVDEFKAHIATNYNTDDPRRLTIEQVREITDYLLQEAASLVAEGESADADFAKV